MWLLALPLSCATGHTVETPVETPDQTVELADVLAVTVSGEEGAWNLAVTVASPDTGCERYASWWEVVDDQEQLVYRRILNHSHPDEQPFTRSGGPVAAASDQVLTVRAHLHPDGYGGRAMRGVPAGGFDEVQLSEGWGASLSEMDPLPEDCWY